MFQNYRRLRDAKQFESGQQTFGNGFMLDSARCLERPGYYRQFIEFAAERGSRWLLWHFTDDQGCSMEFDAAPGIASPHAYSKVAVRELIAFAKSHGIEMIPELASLGHSRFLTRLPAYQHLTEGDGHFSGMCPVSDETRSTVRQLIHEVLDVFDSPNVHVGLDEVALGGHPLTQAALKTNTAGGLLADYANFLHGVLKDKGRRMWMWGDGLLAHDEMLRQIDREVVICNWQYTPDASPATTQTLLEAGFDVVLCSALISHDQTLFPGERFGLPNVRALQSQRNITGRGQLLGHLCTIWTPVRFIAESLWLGVDLAAAILASDAEHVPSPADVAARSQAFAESFHGLNGDAAESFALATRALIENSPLRPEWLAVARLDSIRPSDLPQITTSAERFTQAHGALLRLRPSATRHPVEFDALLLLAQLLAHTYDAAVKVANPKTSGVVLARLARRGEAIVTQVERAWDRERYADDPRKFAAPVESFQSDHLLPLLQSGLTKLKEKVVARSNPPAVADDWAVASLAET